MKRFLGLIAMLLGVIGCLLCLAGIFFVWQISNQYLGKAAATADSVKQMLSKTGDRVDRLQDGVRQTESQVATVGEEARQLVEKNAPVVQAKLRSMVDNLASKVTRSEDIAEVLHATTSLLHESADLADSLSADTEKVEKIRSAEEKLNEAIEALARARKTLTVWQQDQDPTFTADDVSAYVSVLVPILGKVLTSIVDVQEYLERAETKVAEVEQKITFWKTAAPALATVLLAWIALGQVSLLGRGWSMLFGSPTNSES